LNNGAGGGRALRKWKTIAPAVLEFIPNHDLAVLDDSTQARKWIEDALARGETRFVAAGGDGSVNLLVDTVVKSAPAGVLPHVCIGAIGLGSSNDFHKPIHKDRLVRGVPFRLDFSSRIAHDVCVFDGGDGLRHHWIINASIGLTARANRFFNGPDRVLRFLKNWSAGAAIAYAAVNTLAAKRDQRMMMQVDCAPPIDVSVTNIGIVKNPNFSGSLTYRSPYEPDSGAFHVHLCEGMSRRRVLLTLWQSSRHGFMGLPSTRTWRARSLAVKAAKEFPVEFDGETLYTGSASFSVLKGAIQICN
ncbi:MAG TPA: diacylglycerol kinase family protein, partial [Dehalococcoidia bacterium]|nr:diacylglycerol kinase family protein [Dehalococcoidia bacterium]